MESAQGWFGEGKNPEMQFSWVWVGFGEWHFWRETCPRLELWKGHLAGGWWGSNSHPEHPSTRHRLFITSHVGAFPPQWGRRVMGGSWDRPGHHGTATWPCMDPPTSRLHQSCNNLLKMSPSPLYYHCCYYYYHNNDYWIFLDTECRSCFQPQSVLCSFSYKRSSIWLILSLAPEPISHRGGYVLGAILTFSPHSGGSWDAWALMQTPEYHWGDEITQVHFCPPLWDSSVLSSCCSNDTQSPYRLPCCACGCVCTWISVCTHPNMVFFGKVVSQCHDSLLKPIKLSFPLILPNPSV